MRKIYLLFMLCLIIVNLSMPTYAQWINSSFKNCKNMNLDRGKPYELISASITGLQAAKSNKRDIRIANQSCFEGGTFIPFQLNLNATDYAEIEFINENNNTNFSIYYNNSNAEFANISLYEGDTGERPNNKRYGFSQSQNQLSEFGWTDESTLGYYKPAFRGIGFGQGKGYTNNIFGNYDYIEVWMRDNATESIFFFPRKPKNYVCDDSMMQGMIFCKDFSSCGNINGWAVCVNNTYTKVMSAGTPNTWMRVTYEKNGSFYDLFLTNQTTQQKVRVSQEIWKDNMENFRINTQNKNDASPAFFDELRASNYKFQTFYDTPTISIGEEQSFTRRIIINSPANSSIFFFNETKNIIFNYSIYGLTEMPANISIVLNGTVINTTTESTAFNSEFRLTEYQNYFKNDLVNAPWNIIVQNTQDITVTKNQTITIDVIPYDITLNVKNTTEINDSSNFNILINTTFTYNQTKTLQGSSCNLTLEGITTKAVFDEQKQSYLVTTNSSTGMKTITSSCAHENITTTILQSFINITDKTPPSITILQTTNGTESALTNITITIQLTDNSSIIEATLLFNNTAFAINTLNKNITINNTIISSFDTLYAWNITALDSNGNKNTTPNFIFIQDSTFPLINSHNEPTNLNTSTTGTLLINTTDNNTITNVEFLIQTPTGIIITTTMNKTNINAGFTHFGIFTSTTAGNYTLLQYNSKDKAGNVQTLLINKTITVIDNTNTNTDNTNTQQNQNNETTQNSQTENNGGNNGGGGGGSGGGGRSNNNRRNIREQTFETTTQTTLTPKIATLAQTPTPKINTISQANTNTQQEQQITPSIQQTNTQTPEAPAITGKAVINQTPTKNNRTWPAILLGLSVLATIAIVTKKQALTTIKKFSTKRLTYLEETVQKLKQEKEQIQKALNNAKQNPFVKSPSIKSLQDTHITRLQKKLLQIDSLLSLWTTKQRTIQKYYTPDKKTIIIKKLKHTYWDK